MSTSTLFEELQRANVRLIPRPDGGLRWEAFEEPPADLIARARAEKDWLRHEVTRRRSTAIGRYQELERNLERDLWRYIEFGCSEEFERQYLAQIVEIDMVEETLRRQFGIEGCISGHGHCTSEQIEAELCCDECRRDRQESYGLHDNAT